MPGAFSSADRTLAARLEAAEAANAIAMLTALEGHVPEACFQFFSGAVALFAGAGSPMTRVVGLGFIGNLRHEELERIEQFYFQRGSACSIDLCTLADVSVLTCLERQPYRLTELNNVLVRRILPDEEFNQLPAIRQVQTAEMSSWSRIVSEGFSESMPVTKSATELLAATFGKAQCWFAPAANEHELTGGAAMGVENGVALFFGDAIIPAARRNGFQTALIHQRLRAAQEQGCEWAVVSVLPGSPSHRNYERAGFQLIYLRLTLQSDFPPKSS